MATKKIAELVAVNPATELLDTNLGEVSLNGAGSRKFTWANLATYIKAALGFGPAAGGAVSTSFLTKRVTNILNGADTAVLTVTVPVGTQAAALLVTFLASEGAGGAIGAGEGGMLKTYVYHVRRMPGGNSVMTYAPTFPGDGAQSGLLATVAGGNALTNTIDDGGMVNGPTGAIGATQTWLIRVNITRAAGASTNHSCTVCAQVLNEGAGGVTVA